MLESLQAFFATTLGSIIAAILLLILAFIAAAVARALVRKLLRTPRISEQLAKGDPVGQPGYVADFIAKFVYLIVFLLFVPGIMSVLHVENAGEPILKLLNTIWGFVPNVLAAAIVLVIGFFVARLVRQLLIPVFRKLRVDKLQEKAGMEVTDTGRLSNTLAYIVYVIIIIPVIIVALEVLQIEAITGPATSMLSGIFNVIPLIFVAIVMIVLGCVIAKFAGQIVERMIAATGIDAKLGELTEGKSGKFILSKFVGTALQVVIIVFFVVEGVSVLGLDILSNIGAAIIGYLPNVLGALIVFVAAVIAVRLAEKAMRAGGFGSYVLIVKIAVYVIAAFMVLNQLGIAATIVNYAFILILAALAVAFAVSFGIGGRNFAATTLQKLSDKAESVAQAKAQAKDGSKD